MAWRFARNSDAWTVYNIDTEISTVSAIFQFDFQPVEVLILRIETVEENAMQNMEPVFVSGIQFSGGQTVSFSGTDKVIIVGPNNSGKSQTLRDIFALSRNYQFMSTKCVSKISISKPQNVSYFKDFLERNSKFEDDIYIINTTKIKANNINSWNLNNLYGAITDMFFKNIDAEGRLKICQEADSKRPNEPYTNPQQVVYDNNEILERVSDLFRGAFGKGLVIDFRGGSIIPIHVGNEAESNSSDRVSDAHIDFVRSLPRLDRQGDGMKSYAGILLEIMSGRHSMIAIDEPEAFLHPPQMRRLGETLAKEVKGQLFVSTHSSDILRGFLEGAQGNVRILRIQRNDDLTLISEPAKETVSELWQKPSLRYSNALEGIFHEQAIICEDDSDCRLINSIADHLALRDADLRVDTAYVPSGGKAAIPKTANVLRKIGVTVKAVFDMDFLSEQCLVKDAYEAFGGDWNSIQTYWKRVDAGVRGGKLAKSAKEIREEISNILAEAPEGQIPKNAIRDALKQDKEWWSVKMYGEAGLPTGGVRADYQKLRDELEGVGIFIVPVGEIERFYPSIGNHGPKFVTELLSTVALGDEALAPLHAFVKRVIV